MKMTLLGLILTLGVTGLLIPLLVETPRETKERMLAEAQISPPCAR